MGLILDTSLFIAEERQRFDLAGWLRKRPPEPVAISFVTVSELFFGIEVDSDAQRTRRRGRWLDKILRRIEVAPADTAIARVHARVWAELVAKGAMIGPHDLIIAATALHRRWAVATFNAAEFRHIRGLRVIEPES